MNFSSVRILHCVAIGAAATGAAMLLLTAGSASAFEVGKDEKTNLKACERSLCEVILKRKVTSDTLSCDLQKTWAESDINEGAKEKKLDWGLGDARCNVGLKVPQEDIVKSLTEAEHTLAIDKHAVKCKIENGEEITDISLTLAPKVKFKDGKAVDAALNWADIEGPTVAKSAIWSTAKLDNNLGVLEGIVLESVNEFFGPSCDDLKDEIAAH